MNINVKFPARIEVDDYHQFADVKNTLRAVGMSNVKVKEVGFIGSYIGIIYVGKLTDKNNAKMIAEVKDEERKYNFYNDNY